MNYSPRRKQTTVYWQLLFAVVLYICCLFSMFFTGSVSLSGQVWLDGIYDSPFLSKALSSVLLLLNAASLVVMLRRFSLIELRNYFPALFYLLFSFLFPQVMNLWSLLTGFFIIVGVLPQLFDLDETNIQSKTFMYGLWCGILSVINFYQIFLLVFIYLVCLLDRIYSFRSFILPIVGASVSFIYLFSILYLTNNSQLIGDFFIFARQKMQEMSLLNIDIERAVSVFSAHHYMSGVLIAGNILLALFSFFRLLSRASSVVINKRKKHYTLLLTMFLLAIYILCFQVYNTLLNHVLLIFYAIVLSLSLSYVKRYGFVFFILLSFFVLSILSVLI